MDYRDLAERELEAFIDYNQHETIRLVIDRESGLKSFIAVHNTNLGPALGGCRVRDYASEDEALRDVLRLSRGMTYKNALAGLPLGGGKSVVLADPYTTKTPAMMAAMGRAIHGLGGRYISAEDSGLTEDDVVVMHGQTPYVTGFHDGTLPGDLGGNPSPVTAHGVFHALKAAVAHKFKTNDLNGLRVNVQGLGSVGFDLCRLLHKEGAKLTVTDVREETLQRAAALMPGLAIVAPDAIFDAEGDVFAPCAMGAQINDETIGRLKVSVVAGAANNQLARAEHGRILADKEILYAPDYVVNSGGVVAVAYEYFARAGHNPFPHELTRANMMRHAERAAMNIVRVFEKAEREDLLPHEAADRLAEETFRAAPTKTPQVLSA